LFDLDFEMTIVLMLDVSTNNGRVSSGIRWLGEIILAGFILTSVMYVIYWGWPKKGTLQFERGVCSWKKQFAFF